MSTAVGIPSDKMVELVPWSWVGGTALPALMYPLGEVEKSIAKSHGVSSRKTLGGGWPDREMSTDLILIGWLSAFLFLHSGMFSFALQPLVVLSERRGSICCNRFETRPKISSVTAEAPTCYFSSDLNL